MLAGAFWKTGQITMSTSKQAAWTTFVLFAQDRSSDLADSLEPSNHVLKMYITAGCCGWANMHSGKNNKEMVTTFKSSLNWRLLVANLSWTWRVQPTLWMIDIRDKKTADYKTTPIIRKMKKNVLKNCLDGPSMMDSSSKSRLLRRLISKKFQILWYPYFNLSHYAKKNSWKNWTTSFPSSDPLYLCSSLRQTELVLEKRKDVTLEMHFWVVLLSLHCLLPLRSCFRLAYARL